MSKTSLIGRSMPRVDAVAKATGKTKYTGDLELPGMLVGRVLRSPLAHARIVSIDTTSARRLRGVKAVVTAADFPHQRYGMCIKDQSPLAREKVRYIGEKVAAVAATDLETAEEALELIHVEYQELAPVFDPLEALRPEAPLVHEGIDGYETAVSNVIKYGNVCSKSRIKRGNVEEGFTGADYVFEDSFSTPMVHQGYLEPPTVIAKVEASGRVTLWTASPAVFKVRDALADILGLSRDSIRVIAGPVGGSFGSKNELRLEPICVRLAQKSGCTVKMTVDCEGTFIDGSPRHASILHLKTGVMRDGRLVAGQARMVFDTGAYAEFGPWVAFEAARMVYGPYRVPHIDLEALCVYTNKISCSCFRSHGTPEPTFAYESQMDIIAAKLGIDPVEIRLKNAVSDGDVSAAGEIYSRVSLQENLRRAAVFSGWGGKPKPKNRGRGIALGQWKTGGRVSGVALRISEHGKVIVATGCVDVTGSDTAIAQVVAEELGIMAADVQIMPIDTDSAPYDAGSSGTRTTHGAGWATRNAAAQMRQRLLALAADMLEANPEDLDIEDGCVFVKGTPGRSASLADVAQGALSTGDESLEVVASYTGRPLPTDRTVIEGIASDSHVEFLHPVQVAEVEVDPENGQVKIISFTSVHDVGKAINPAGVTGQIEGGVSQGLGYGLLEELACQDGAVLSPSGMPYPQPTALDVPGVESILVEDGQGLGPYGAKGIAEAPIIPTAPAIANAVWDAVGVRIKSLPVTPEKISQALQEKEGTSFSLLI
ncbi:MAG: xanthine dehydrogenase family protein molybdopterin-binding subunit [Chloroflexi bacterium]|nr:xanthine dehydrogenase family protein molybdopterin-binding subunit [Chloroflexota bacterium]